MKLKVLPKVHPVPRSPQGPAGISHSRFTHPQCPSAANEHLELPWFTLCLWNTEILPHLSPQASSPRSRKGWNNKNGRNNKTLQEKAQKAAQKETMSGATNPRLMSDPAPDKGKYFLMKSKHGPCRCGKNAAGRYFQFPMETGFAVGLFECCFFISRCPLPSLLFPWGLGSTKCPHSRREQTQGMPVQGARGSLCSMINSPADWGFWYCTSDNNNPHTWECFSTKPTLILATALKHLLKSGKFEIFPFFPFPFFPFLPFLLPCGWHFPPSFPFPSPVQKKLYLWGR